MKIWYFLLGMTGVGIFIVALAATNRAFGTFPKPRIPEDEQAGKEGDDILKIGFAGLLTTMILLILSIIMK